MRKKRTVLYNLKKKRCIIISRIILNFLETKPTIVSEVLQLAELRTRETYFARGGLMGRGEAIGLKKLSVGQINEKTVNKNKYRLLVK